MLEVLIALVVLSVGLLGLAGLQANGLKNNNSAYQRSQANLMVNEILDRIRANRSGLASGNYDNPFATTPTDKGCDSSICNPADMAEYDAFLWQGQVASILPSGVGAITGSGADSVFTITIMWDDDRDGGSDCTDLTCFIVSTRL